MFNPSTPLNVGKRLVNLSEGVQAPVYALPVLVFVDEYQALMSQPVIAGQTHEAAEVIL